MDKVKTIVSKEWSEVFRNRLVLFTVLFMPLMFSVLPLIFLYFMRGGGIGGGGDVMGQLPPAAALGCIGLTGAECLQVYMLSQFMMLFMLSPLIIPVNIASYSVVGEKTTRSLEPLLATPITTAELLAGKNLAAAIPAVLANWLSFAIFGIGVRLLAAGPNVLAALFRPMWLVAIVLISPLLAIMSVNFALMVSSRVSDPRVAEQLSAVVIVPVLLLFFGQVAGIAVFSQRNMALLAAALVAVDGLFIYLAVRLFQRETILTRWK